MKNSKALVSLSNEARNQIITMLEAKDQEEVVGWLLDEVNRITNNHVQVWELPSDKELAPWRLDEIGRLEALEIILRVNNDYFIDELTSDELLQMLTNDIILLSELFAALGTRIYFNEIIKREEYKVKDLIMLLKTKEEE